MRGVERRNRSVRGAAAALLALAAGLAAAHHSVVTNFDTGTTVRITGTVRSVAIRNPHSQYVLEAAEPGGEPAEWLVEWSDRNSLVRRGVAIDRIEVGDRITVVVWPSRRLERVGYFVEATLPDGSTFRDCGFREFREAIVSSEEFDCPEARGERR